MLSRPRVRWAAVASVGVLVAVVAATAHAQKVGNLLGKENISQNPVMLILALAGFSLAPLVMIMVTSFVKITVVFAILRQAIGTAQIPPTQIITGLALVMTLFIMTPVGLEAYHNGRAQLLKMGIRDVNLQNVDPRIIAVMVDVTQQPIRQFLIKHAHPGERAFFFRLSGEARNERDRKLLSPDDFTILAPAFVISEMKEAFQIGFILFLPFLVIDYVIGNILMALGMQMLSPTTLSLPFKILLFVMVDGWYLITKGLVIGYL